MAGEQASAASAAPSGPYGEGDFVLVADAAGVVQADAVPKSWVGTSLLPEGFKAATKAQVAEHDQQGDDTAQA